MKTPLKFAAAAVIAAVIAASPGTTKMAAGGEPEVVKQTIESSVKTGRTSWDGARETATSGWTTLKAPAGYVVDKERTKVHMMNRRGSENSWDIEYSTYVPIVKGFSLKAPRTIRVRTYARSPKGKFHMHTGTTVVVVDVYFTKLP